MKTKRPTVAELLARVEALEAKVAALSPGWAPAPTINGIPYWARNDLRVECGSITTAHNTITA